MERQIIVPQTLILFVPFRVVEHPRPHHVFVPQCVGSGVAWGLVGLVDLLKICKLKSHLFTISLQRSNANPHFSS